ncbi:efflux RND transporter periplasmic adaptor subunit [Ectothiorhodospira lacustris]|uniref:efflux RND transporter periplasmic adaptor subunit n=1 Tax=Ectothiorhodospira lacustris TaxID=2899127 RepID=UPI001EE88ECF|nr:efflux RND transporter periplasmic adaptor subunit [Ectothiorhodospira lacustris]MCG5510222.1 efflux RND transporter periplasmic adaptor subunit [Ectothiorhodospira lacustris]MCG5521911.1 efflux RND transporter periplasmic adaptor subunit [Ectothiorhodospira lacustris]
MTGLSPRLVDSVLLGPAELPARRQFPGEVRADQRAELAFIVSGPLVDLPIQEGQFVEAGTLLARIDPRDFVNERDGRRADRNEARSRFDRIERAFAAGVVTAAERDQSRARFQVADAELALAQKRLEDTELLAPFPGRVARRLVENFQTVQAGEPVLLLEDISRLEVRIQLPELDVVRLPAGRSLLGTEVGTVSFDVLPGRRFPVSVKELETRADPRTNTYRVVLSLPPPEGANILPGMSASFVPHDAVVGIRSMYFLPVEALQATSDRSAFVWLLDPEQSTVQRRSVRIGGLSGRTVQVLEGLSEGDRVVTAGAAYLADGEQVRMRD